MKNLKKKKGFTLIELMIVLAIIGILAVVLVPKVGTMKDSARSSGIAANVNTVRAYLETKTMDNFPTGSTSAEAATALAATMVTDFDNGDTIKNPLTNSTAINTTNSNASADVAQAVYVGESAPGTLGNYSGSVVVIVNHANKSYTIYGINKNGTALTSYIVK